MAFTESLTVRILGDSSHLKRELEQVAADLRNLRSDLEQASQIGEQVGQGLGRSAQAIRPLEQISQVLRRIAEQAQSLSQTPIEFNVQPALQSLQQLSQSIAAVAAQLAALSVPGAGGGGGGGPSGPGPLGGGGGGPIRQFAAGGLVAGPAGTDMVPALLTAGEFVLSRRATEALGASFLNSLNARPMTRPAVGESREGSSRMQTTNHFGGITIQVDKAADVNGVVRDLRFQGVHLRNRRG